MRHEHKDAQLPGGAGTYTGDESFDMKDSWSAASTYRRGLPLNRAEPSRA